METGNHCEALGFFFFFSEILQNNAGLCSFIRLGHALSSSVLHSVPGNAGLLETQTLLLSI